MLLNVLPNFISYLVVFAFCSFGIYFQVCYGFQKKQHATGVMNNGTFLTNTWSIKLKNVHNDKQINDAKAFNIAYSLGMVSLGQVGELNGHYVFTNELDTPVDGMIEAHEEIIWGTRQEVLLRDKRAVLPKYNVNFHSDKLVIDDPLFNDQWHLKNNRKGGIDCNVTGVWKNDITGKGTVVAIVDDGVEWRHPDLLDNYCAAGSFDLNSNDDDPSPELDNDEENKHGTRCAGEVAAVKNSVCGVGIAYNSQFSGIRILDGIMTDSMEATAFNKFMDVNDIYSCSWGPQDDGKTVDGPRTLAQAALRHGVVAGRQSFGSIFIAASGNGGTSGDNCNYDGYANSIYTITIAAVDEFGQTPDYAEQCTSMMACTVSSGTRPARSIVTTDWTLGNSNTQCTEEHTGTSAATPLVAGMVALMLEARPCLTWRDVQHIIAMTAKPLDYKGANRNAAGFYHSDKHGFGLLDSWKLVNAAKIWVTVPWLTSMQPAISGSDWLLKKPNDDALRLKCSVAKQASDEALLFSLEHVVLKVTFSHPYRGKLKFILICPSGTRSVIRPRHNDDSSSGLTDWEFNTVKCWGEVPYGVYTLEVYDLLYKPLDGQKVLHSWHLTLYGSKFTSNEIKDRLKQINDAMSGEYIHPSSNFSLPCPLGQDLIFDVTTNLSERTLKLIALLSGFFLFWGVYYVLEIAFCTDKDNLENEENQESLQITAATIPNPNIVSYSTMPSAEEHIQINELSSTSTVHGN